MPHYELKREEIEKVLRDERVMRVGFDVGPDRFLVPLGYLWHDGALYGMTTRGRKTEMGTRNPQVSFQIRHIRDDRALHLVERCWRGGVRDRDRRQRDRNPFAPSVRALSRHARLDASRVRGETKGER